MKKIIAVTLSLLSLSAFALNLNTTWHARGQKLKIVSKRLVGNTTFSTKEGAVQGALNMMEDMSSGDMSKAAKYAFRRSFDLHGAEKCRGTGGLIRTIEAEMAKGKFQVNSINVGSYFNGQGEEAFSYSVKYYAPCVMKDRD